MSLIKTPGADAVLAEIDAVTRDMDVMCFCGCGILVTIASPSMYFASQACSELWHEFAHLPEEEAAAERESCRQREAALVQANARTRDVMATALQEARARRFGWLRRDRYSEVTEAFLAHAVAVRDELDPDAPPSQSFNARCTVTYATDFVDPTPPALRFNLVNEVRIERNHSRLRQLQEAAVQAINEWMNRD